MTSGQIAEARAAEYLKSLGFSIVDRNWKLPQCEIDIIASKAKTIYFVEVKYRRSPIHGSGLEYVTAQKIDRMSFAAEMWVAHNKWNNGYQLSAIEVSGPQFQVTAFVPEVI